MILATLVYILCNIYSYISMENDSRPINQALNWALYGFELYETPCMYV